MSDFQSESGGRASEVGSPDRGDGADFVEEEETARAEPVSEETVFNRRRAAGFFGWAEADEAADEDLLDEEEKAAFASAKRHSEKAAQHSAKRLRIEDVLPPDDLKRLYLTKGDQACESDDVPERVTSALERVEWTQAELNTLLFYRGQQREMQTTALRNMQSLTMFIKERCFKDVGAHELPEIERTVTLMWLKHCEPPFIQRYCLPRSRRVRSSNWTLDDVWAVWNSSLDWMKIWKHREQLRDALTPIHEALMDNMYTDALTTRWQTASYKDRLRYHDLPGRRLPEYRTKDCPLIESVGFEMYKVSVSELSKTGECPWSWDVNYLSWMEQWLAHWHDVLTPVCNHFQTTSSFRHSDVRKPTRKDAAVTLRARGLYRVSNQVLPHPSAIAYYLTCQSNTLVAATLTGTLSPEEIKDFEDTDRVTSISYLTRVFPVVTINQAFHQLHRTLAQDPLCGSRYLFPVLDPGLYTSVEPKDMWTDPRRLRKAVVQMIGGSLSKEPRFRQLILELICGTHECQGVMTLGRIRTQPTPTGHSYFKQGGTRRHGYYNLCFGSKEFSTQMKADIVSCVQRGVMVWWLELDDPSVVKREVDKEQAALATKKAEALAAKADTRAASMSRAALTAKELTQKATTRIVGTGVGSVRAQQAEVSRLNMKREQLCASRGFSSKNTSIWFASDTPFHDFRKSLCPRKADIITRVLRDAHRDGNDVPISSLPFVPLDDWFTREHPAPVDGVDPEQEERERLHKEAHDSWIDFRVSVVRLAVELCLDEVEAQVWRMLCEEVRNKVLTDACVGLRRMSFRSGFQQYRVKGLNTDDMDATAKQLLKEDDLFNREEKEYVTDTSDKTPHTRYRIAGMVYDEGLCQHTICFLDAYGNFIDSFSLEHFNLQEEDSLVIEKMDAMQVKLKQALGVHKPDALVIGLTDPSDLRVRDMLRKFLLDWERLGDLEETRGLLSRDFKIPKLEMCSAAVARVWARSRQAALECKDLTEVQRRAVSVGRTMRNPLAEAANLFNSDRLALSLPLSDMQHLISTEADRASLWSRLEQTMVSLVSVVGVDINNVLNEASRMMHGVLQFVPGMGPRKSKRVLRLCYGAKRVLAERKDLRREPFAAFIGQTIYRNAAGFIIVKEPEGTAEDGETTSCVWDTTRVHPMFYPLAQTMIAEIELGLGHVTDTRLLEEFDDEAWAEWTMGRARALIDDYQLRREKGETEVAFLEQVDWEEHGKNWGLRYPTSLHFAKVCSNDQDLVDYCDGVKAEHIIEMFRDELLDPFGFAGEQSRTSESRSMQMYRPISEPEIFDIIVPDAGLTRGALRVVTVTATTNSSVKVRVAGADGVTGIIPRAETVPGSLAADHDWLLNKDAWFPKRDQFEAVVTGVRKESWMVTLTALPDRVKEAKVKMDKQFQEIQKVLLKQKQEREKEIRERVVRDRPGGDLLLDKQSHFDMKSRAVQSRLAGTHVESTEAGDRHTVSRRHPAAMTVLGGATTMGARTLRSAHITDVSDDGGDPTSALAAAAAAAAEGGAGTAGSSLTIHGPIINHPNFAHGVRSVRQAEIRMSEEDYSEGDALVCQDLSAVRRDRFWVTVKVRDVPVNEYGSLDAERGQKNYAFLHLPFRVRASSSGATAPEAVVENPQWSQEGEQVFDNVDHLIYSHCKALYNQCKAVTEHKRWTYLKHQQVLEKLTAELRQARESGSKQVSWYLCDFPEHGDIDDGGHINPRLFCLCFAVPAARSMVPCTFVFGVCADHFNFVKGPSGLVFKSQVPAGLRTVQECEGLFKSVLLKVAGKRQQAGSPARSLRTPVPSERGSKKGELLGTGAGEAARKRQRLR
eukprot:TRINITY_DN6352_c0_g2_i1.p1 TRINITY_DN6352_c0_g2~~TRINITY_DN6352_c0_g2_i1.p1  ORF type:complete len:1824 (+),score=389.86 TRINITY_DN6352_c0_g2_i1:81-5552(+)